jgi:hypothetical protein
MMEKLRWLSEHRHQWIGWMWIGLAIPALLWWKDSVPFLIAMSLYANIEASFAAHNAKKAQESK